jgi:phosphoglycolate phosphatase
MFGRTKGIIWDWNGTLLNDVDLCVSVMNGLLQKRQLPPLSIDRYQQVFTFPVKDYYQKIGFDFETEAFEIPAMEFIDGYSVKVPECGLQNNSLEILETFKSRGFRQFVVSAMEQQELEKCLDRLQIRHYFEHVSGLDNHFASSKIENGKRLISELKIDAADIIFIGDTVHDFEVASELGCSCILIAGGHQSKKVLQTTGAPVFDRLEELLSSNKTSF